MLLCIVQFLKEQLKWIVKCLSTTSIKTFIDKCEHDLRNILDPSAVRHSVN